MKKIYNFIALFAILAFVPSALYAQSSEGHNYEGVVTSKTVYPEFSEDGNYTLSLKTYVTGEVITSSTHTAADIVLLIDRSSSMNEWVNIGKYSTCSELIASLNSELCAGSGIYDLDGDYNLRYKDGKWQVDMGGLFSDWEDLTEKLFNNEEFYNYTLRIQKLGAIKIAAYKFIDAIHTDCIENDVEHRISIVTFSSSASTKIDLTSAKTGVSDLKAIIKNIDTGGDTYPDEAFDKAYGILNPSTAQTKTVILFTDGAPAKSGSSYTEKIANDAIANAKKIKDWDGKQYIVSAGGVNHTYKRTAKVYTVGIFKDSDKYISQITTFMNYSSSNYPNATDMSTPGTGGDTSKGFYRRATDAVDLSLIFTGIAEEIGGASVEVSSSSQIIDKVTPQFELPGGITVDNVKNFIKVYTADCTGKENDKLTFNEAGKTLFSEAQITYNVDSNTGLSTIIVTNFPFSDNWCGTYNSVYRGKELIIEIPIIADENTAGGIDIPTNTDDSGLYIDGELITQFDIPDVDLPVLLTIKKNGLASGHTAVFTIEKTGYLTNSGHWEGEFETQTVIITGQGKNTPVTACIKVFPAKYRVTETSWSYGYEPDHTVVEKEVVEEASAVFEFTNKTKEQNDPVGEAVATNKWDVNVQKVVRVE